ncbi:MAG: pre-mRNA-splicing factor prp46 [Cirrosporium novae-zelandiae]|nr:MAG: pre-mRNA-splicing factor prp46 [Cirrosporium novae-zelandiae]
MMEVSRAEEFQAAAAESRNRLRTRSLFGGDYGLVSTLGDSINTAEKTALAVHVQNEYDDVRELPPALAAKQANAAAAARKKRQKAQGGDDKPSDPRKAKLIEGIPTKNGANGTGASSALVIRNGQKGTPNANGPTLQRDTPSSSLIRRQNIQQPRPDWHAPWKLMRVISGHIGWVESLTVEPGNEWFASGAGDRLIKIWDLASGQLKLTLTGHISPVTGLAVSPRHPYLFSCGEDKMVKCWDLETNKVIRHYHGHLSAVKALSLHPTLDVLVTAGRDGVARVWDMRTRSNIHVLSGHKQWVSDVKCQEADPQVITASQDSTIRLWDLAAGKTMSVLTHHKKGVRTLAVHPTEFTFASGSTGSIKQWKCPEGAFMQNFEGHNSIINTLSVNEDNVLFSGGDNGSMAFWDWKSGYKYQSLSTIAQPGSLDAEAGIKSSTFDHTGLRLIVGESDKTIKVWKQDEEATPESYPLEWKPTLGRQKY